MESPERGPLTAPVLESVDRKVSMDRSPELSSDSCGILGCKVDNYMSTYTYKRMYTQTHIHTYVCVYIYMYVLLK